MSAIPVILAAKDGVGEVLWFIPPIIVAEEHANRTIVAGSR